jgi:hypothetical protein
MPRYPAECSQYTTRELFRKGNTVAGAFAQDCAKYMAAFLAILYIFLALTLLFLFRKKPCGLELRTQRKMAEASAADGKMKDLKISETKKNKKDGTPKTAAKKPQQQKKKVSFAA